MDIKKGILSNEINTLNYSKHVYYRVEFKDNNGNEYIADILTRSPIWYGIGRRNGKKPDVYNINTKPAIFETAGEIVKGAFSPLTISRGREDHTDPMFTSTATLKIWSDTDRKYLHLTQETDAVMLYVWTKKTRIDVGPYRLVFTGVLDSSQYIEPYHKREGYFVELTFQDYGQLKRTKHALTQGKTVQEHIQKLLSQRFDCCGYRDDLPNEDVPLNLGIKGIRPDISLFEDDKGKRDDAFSVLSMLLKNFGFTLVQTNNVLERVDLTQIYIKKGEDYKGEPTLKEASHDNTLSIIEQAKEVEVSVKIAGTDKESKGVKHPGNKGMTLKVYRHDVVPELSRTNSMGEILPKYYPAYEVNFLDYGSGFYMGKVYKFTEGEEGEEFLTLFYNCIDVTPLRTMFGGNYERHVAKNVEDLRTGYETRYALPAHRMNDLAPEWNKAPERYDITQRVVYGTIEQNNKYTTISDGFVLCDPILLPNKKNLKTIFDLNDPDYFLTLGLKLKVGIYSNLYHNIRALELRDKINQSDEFSIDSINTQMDHIWKNNGACLYGAVLALDEGDNIVAYLKAENMEITEVDMEDLNWEGIPFSYKETLKKIPPTIKYSWAYVDEQTKISTKDAKEIKAGEIIDNKIIKDYACGFPFGGINGINYGRWQSISNPPYTPNNDIEKREEMGTIFEDEGLHLTSLPEEKNGRTPIKLVFVCFRKLVIALRENETYFATKKNIQTDPNIIFSNIVGFEDNKWWGVRQYLGINMSYTDLLTGNGGVYSERDGKMGDYPFYVKTKRPGQIGSDQRNFYPIGCDKREILSPYYILVKDPEIKIHDFKTILNQGEEYKESKTTLKSIYSKGNTDTIKETLFYDDKMDIPLTSPSRVFAPNVDAITPHAEGADFRFFSFSDLRAFDILTKKGVGLINMEGSFKYAPDRHWGVYYHRGNKFIASREEIDLKVGTAHMTLHQLAQAEPNTITKKINKDE